MTIKITCDSSCDDTFEPYTLTLHVDNVDDHRALKYLSMGTSTIPDALSRKALVSLGNYKDHVVSIKSRSRSFLIALAAQIPKRGGW